MQHLSSFFFLVRGTAIFLASAGASSCSAVSTVSATLVALAFDLAAPALMAVKAGVPVKELETDSFCCADGAACSFVSRLSVMVELLEAVSAGSTVSYSSVYVVAGLVRI